MVVPRFVRPLCQVYWDLIHAYQSGPDTLDHYLQQHQATFVRLVLQFTGDNTESYV